MAASPLNEEFKELILKNLDKLPSYLIFDLIESLEKEQDNMGRLAVDIEQFLKQQNDDWQNLEKAQKEAAKSIMESEISKIEDELKLDQLRKQTG